MDKKTIENLYHTAKKLAKVKDFYDICRQKIGKTLWKTAYWGGVVALGLVASVGIMEAAGLDIVQPAYADAGFFTYLIGNLIYYYIIGPIGLLTIIVAFIMQAIINYPYGALWSGSNGFVNVSAVVTGWQLVRDVCNIFFSIILVIIALATVLGIEAYHWKKLLPNFILMAVLINFSKSICGIFTDLATVLMATFGGSFAGSFATGLIGAFGLPTAVGGAIGSEDANKTEGASIINVLLSYIAAAIMTLVFFVVIIVFTVVLIFRIIMLWFLIVLSPLAYITRILPQTRSKSSEWWKKFGQYCAVGPLVTFFLWLSLTMAFSTGDTAEVSKSNAGGNELSSVINVDDAAAAGQPAIESKGDYAASTSPNVLANFLIATMMLMASLQFIQEMAGEIGKYTGKLQEGAFGLGKAWVKGAYKMPQRAALKGFSKMGTPPPPPGQADTRTARQKLMYGLGSAGATASLLARPDVMYSSIKEGLEKRSKSKEDASLESARGRFDEMRRTGGRLGVATSMIGGLGTDAENVFRNDLSYDGWQRSRKARKVEGNLREAEILEAKAAAAKKGETTAKVPKRDDNGVQTKNSAGELEYEDVEVDVSVKQAEAQLAAIRGRMSEADFEKMKVDMQTSLDLSDVIAQSQTDLDGDLARRDAADLDWVAADEGSELAAPVALAAISAALQDLTADLGGAQADGDTTRATSLRSAIRQLEALRDSGGSVRAGAILAATRDTGSEDQAHKHARQARAVKHMQDANSSVSEQNEKEITAFQVALEGAGAVFNKDADGNRVDVNGQIDITNPDAITFKGDDDDEEKQAVARLDEVKKEVSKMRAEASRLRREYKAAQPVASYSARVGRQKLVGEKMEQIKHIKNSEEVRAHLQKAIDEGDQYLAEACLRHVGTLGDLNEVVQQDMSDDPGARSDAEGLENYRQKILMDKLGMTSDQSFSLANDLTYDAEDRGYLSFARAYRQGPSGWEFVRDDHDPNDPDEDGQNRSANVAAETIKKPPTQWTNFHRLAYGYEDKDRKFQLSSVGIRLLVKGGETLGQEYNWNRMNANTKQELSDPAIVQQLIAAGVSSALTDKLKSYRTRQDSTSGDMTRALAAYKQREAEKRQAA